MPNRLKQHRHKIDQEKWSTDQDCLLIENNQLPIDQLCEMLSYTKDEILKRKQILGLTRRDFSLKKLNT